MKISNYSSLVRVVDPRYPTNLAILTLSTLTGGVLFLVSFYQGDDLVDSIIVAVVIGLTVFLTWALGREIDPEHELSAFVGLALVIAGYWLFEAPNLMTVFAMLLLLRLLNRTTGSAPKLLDSLSILGLGAYLSFKGDWILGLLTAAVFYLDSRLPSPKQEHLYFSGIMAAISFGTIIILKPPAPQFAVNLVELLFVLCTVLLFTPLIGSSRDIDFACDLPGEKINPRRLQTCQIFSLSAAVLVWLFYGISGISDLLPLWAAVIGVSLAFLSTSLFNKIRKP